MEADCSFRKGRPQDYISLCTNTDYVSFNPKNQDHIQKKEEIEEFMRQSFPNPSLVKIFETFGLPSVYVPVLSIKIVLPY